LDCGVSMSMGQNSLRWTLLIPLFNCSYQLNGEIASLGIQHTCWTRIKEPPAFQQRILNQRHPRFKANQIISLYVHLIATKISTLSRYPAPCSKLTFSLDVLKQSWIVFGLSWFNLDTAYSSKSLSTHFWFSVPSQGLRQCWYSSLLEAALLGLWVMGEGAACCKG